MSPKSFGCLWIGYILFSFFSIGVAKQLAQTGQDIFFITSGAESGEEGRDEKKKGEEEEEGRGEKKLRQLTFIGSHNFINSAEIWARDLKEEEDEGGGVGGDT